MKRRDLTGWLRPPGSCLELLFIVILLQSILTDSFCTLKDYILLFSLTWGRFTQNKAFGGAPVWHRQHTWWRCVGESCGVAASEPQNWTFTNHVSSCRIFSPSSHNSISVIWLQAQEESWQRSVRLCWSRPAFLLIFPPRPTAAETVRNRISHLKGRDEGKNES